MIVWVLESIYDLIFPADKTKTVKKKSAIGSSKKKKSDEKEAEAKPDADKKKDKREKIEWHVSKEHFQIFFETTIN